MSSLEASERSTAVATVLSIPRLVDLVLDHLQVRDICNLIQVNRHLFHAGVKRLYRNLPYSRFLALSEKCENERRLDEYFHVVNTLDFDREEPSFTKWEDIFSWLPRANKLVGTMWTLWRRESSQTDKPNFVLEESYYEDMRWDEIRKQEQLERVGDVPPGWTHQRLVTLILDWRDLSDDSDSSDDALSSESVHSHYHIVSDRLRELNGLLVQVGNVDVSPQDLLLPCLKVLRDEGLCRLQSFNTWKPVVTAFPLINEFSSTLTHVGISTLSSPGSPGTTTVRTVLTDVRWETLPRLETFLIICDRPNSRINREVIDQELADLSGPAAFRGFHLEARPRFLIKFHQSVDPAHLQANLDADKLYYRLLARFLAPGFDNGSHRDDRLRVERYFNGYTHEQYWDLKRLSNELEQAFDEELKLYRSEHHME